MKRDRERATLLQGSLDLLILKTLSVGRLHGWGISKRIRQVTGDALEVNQGSLYPALYRLEGQRLVATEWGESEDGRRVKVYRLTAAGRARLAREQRGWRAFADAVEAILALEAP